MKNLELEFLHSELVRTCEWIKFSDQKSGFASIYYSAIFGFLLSYKGTILAYINSHQGFILWFYYLALLANAIFFTIGLFWLFKSIFPQLKNLTTDKSVFYFQHIAALKFIDYTRELKKLSDANVKEQIIEQIHTNSVIASQKMGNVQKSIKFLFALILSLIVLVVF